MPAVRVPNSSNLGPNALRRLSSQRRPYRWARVIPFPSTAIIDAGTSGVNPLASPWVGPFDLGATNQLKSNGTSIVDVDGTAYGSMYRSDQLFADGEAYVTGGPNDNLLIFRLQPDTFPSLFQAYYLYWWPAGGSADVELHVHAPGIDTVLEHGGAAPNAGDLVGTRFIGTRIEVYQNGNLVISHDVANDSTQFTTAGYIGLETDTSSTVNGFTNLGGGQLPVLLAQTYTISIDGAFTPAGALANLGSKTLAGTLTSGGVLLKQASKLVAGATTPAGTLLKRPGKTLAGTLTSSGALAKTVTKTAAGTLTSSGGVAKLAAKSFAGTLTSSGALQLARIVVITLAGTLTSAGTLTKRAGKTAAGSVTPAGALAKQIAKTLAGAMSPTGTISKLCAKALAGATSPSGLLAKLAKKTAAGTLTCSGTVGTAVVKLITLAGTLTSSGALRKLTAKTTAGTLTSAGICVRAVTKVTAGAVTPAGGFAKTILKGLAGAVTSSGVLTTIAGAVTFITRFFDGPSPSGGADEATPAAGIYDENAPGAHTYDQTSDAGTFDQASPGQERT